MGGARAAATAAATASAVLEGWRPPVLAALQPVLLLDAELGVVAASGAARRLLGLGPTTDLRAASALGDAAQDVQAWEALPFVRAVRTGRPQCAEVELAGSTATVLASPLFGPAGVLGATAFLSSG